MVATFNRPDDDAMTTYSWQVHDLSGNLIATNDPLNPRDLYQGIFGMWNYYDPDPNTNPNANPNYPYVGTWYWHRLNGVKDTDDTVDLSNIDNYFLEVDAAGVSPLRIGNSLLCFSGEKAIGANKVKISQNHQYSTI